MTLTQSGNCLELDELTTTVSLARRLPRELACECHAVPIAAEDNRLTVAMADPLDQRAQAAVTDALGTKPYIVRASRVAIDRVLAQVWQPDESSLGLRIGDGNVPYTESALAYGRRLAGLLGARLEISAAARPAELPAGPGDAPLPQDQQRWSKYEPCSDADAPSGVMLIIYQPKWPLQQLLLLITAGEPPGDAVKWTTLLARAVNASVNVLAVVPTKPEGLAALLDSRSELGSQLHHLARELAVENVQATLRLREQDPSQESCFDAVVGESYDLMLATRATCERWLCGWRRPFLIMGATSDGSPWQTSDAALVGEPTGGM